MAEETNHRILELIPLWTNYDKMLHGSVLPTLGRIISQYLSPEVINSWRYREYNLDLFVSCHLLHYSFDSTYMDMFEQKIKEIGKERDKGLVWNPIYRHACKIIRYASTFNLFRKETGYCFGFVSWGLEHEYVDTTSYINSVRLCSLFGKI